MNPCGDTEGLLILKEARAGVDPAPASLVRGGFSEPKKRPPHCGGGLLFGRYLLGRFGRSIGSPLSGFDAVFPGLESGLLDRVQDELVGILGLITESFSYLFRSGCQNGLIVRSGFLWFGCHMFVLSPSVMN